MNKSETVTDTLLGSIK